MSSVFEEYQSVQNGLGLIALPHPVLFFEGPDWRKCLQGALSNDLINLLGPRQGLAACHLNPKGKLVAALKLFQFDDKGAFVFISPTEAENLQNQIKTILLFSQTELKDVSLSYAWIFGIGKEAIGFAEENFGIANDLPSLGHQSIRIGEMKAEFIKEKGWLSPSFLLLIPREGLSRIFEKIQTLPIPFPLKIISPQTLEVLRIESGIPAFGQDMDEKTIPQEALCEEDYISYSKGCYVGQETISRVHHLGHVNRHLCRLVLEAKAPPSLGSSIFYKDNEVGKISSCAFSPRLEKVVALAILRREVAQKGEKVTVKSREKDIETTIL